MTVATEMSTPEVLRAARAKIASRSGWTQTSEARDRFGRSLDALDVTACKFCPIGALICVLNITVDEEQNPQYVAAMSFLATVIREKFINRVPYAEDPDGWVITGFNDDTHRTHDEVLEVFDAAIALAEDVAQ